jgi:hypothetical protein
MTVDELVELVRSSIDLKEPDQDVAAYLALVSPSERLDDPTIEDLRAAGGGPKTIDRLRTLRRRSQSLPAPPQAVSPSLPAPPSVAEQGEAVESVRQYALNYTASLPDFLCTQVTRRYVRGGLFWGGLADTLTAHVAFTGQKEEYKVVSRNGRPASNWSLMWADGATSEGEFGSMMAELFKPSTEVSFHWERWATLRGRRAHVYSFRVAQKRSRWRIQDARFRLHVVAGYHGLILVDSGLPAVLRIVEVAELPATFPMQSVEETLDYDLAGVGGRQYLLPLRAVVMLREGIVNRTGVMNVIEFGGYRKFAAESSVSFDDPAPPAN